MNDSTDTDTDTDTALWHVEASSGQVLVVTLEQLDEAFNEGLVNEQTRVWQEGMGCAVSLGELLGLDSDGTTESAAPIPAHAQSAYPPAPALVPQAHTPSAYPPAPALVPQAHAQSACPPARVTMAPPRIVVESASWPPVSRAPASRSVPPPASSPAAWQSNAAPSVIPTAFDVLDDVPFAKPKRRGGVILALVALAAVAAGAAVYANGSGEAAAAAATPPAPVEAPKSHAIDVGNEPIHLRDVPPLEITKADAPVAATAKASPAEAASRREAALRAANSKVSHARAKIASARPAHGAGKSGATGFKGTKSGSKYDPLNGAL